MPKKQSIVPGSRRHRRECLHRKTEWRTHDHDGKCQWENLVCLSCGKTVEQKRPVPVPFTRDRVLAWIMPWGPHEGKRLTEIPKDYLEVALTILQPGSNPHRAITACLEMFAEVPA